MTNTLDMRKNPCPIPMIQARRALEATGASAVVVWVDNEIAVQNLEKMALGLGYGFSCEKLGELHWAVRIWKRVGEGEGAGTDGGEGVSANGVAAPSMDLPGHAGDERPDASEDVSAGASADPRGGSAEALRSGMPNAADGAPPASGAPGQSPLSPPPAPQIDPQAATILISSDQLGRGSEELGRILIKGFVFALTALPVPPSTLLFMNAGVKLVALGSGVLPDLMQLAERGTKILACGTCLNYYALTDQLAVGTITDMYDIASRLATADRLISL